ncbi:MAG: carboxypeptidase regulatory-like domain-containing protein [Candidatus Thermoplasmatota archaeon]|nr:carboxypeptidase regulatory-like domain-containing protein [Candidatus Thermoplasmatota archaeon]
MNERVRHVKELAAMAVCLSMICGMLVILPSNGAAAPPEGYIQGNLSDGTNPLTESLVFCMATFGGIESSAWTDAEGNYSIAVPGGLDYMVMAFNDSCYAGLQYVRVMSDETVYLNFTLDDIAPEVTDVTVMGYVKDELSGPVVDTIVSVYSADPANMGEGPPMYMNMTRTDGLGLFTVDVLPSIAGGGVAALGVPGYPFSDNTTDEPLVSGQTYWINLTLMPLVYDDDATISGTVTDADSGLPIEGVLIMTDSWNESSEESSSNLTWTDSDGRYYMDIESGWVRITMSKPGYTMYMQESIEVLPGEDEVVDASLRTATAVVRGNVTDKDTGLPISFAQVYMYDPVNGSMNMAFTNATGAYTLEAFDGSGLVIGAQAEGYGRQYVMLDIDPGDELWIDFELGAIDASVSGKVTDVFSGLPIQYASVHYSSMAYENWDNTDVNGDYDMDLVSGDYMVEVHSPMHSYKTFGVTISPGPNVVDIELMPWEIPDTVRMYGYVNDSSSGAGIFDAQVDVGVGPPDYSERNGTASDLSGQYEIYIPPVELIVVVSAPDHTHVETAVNASAETEIRMDFVLDQDIWSPNLTYSQSPTENVSWTNPTWIHVSAQELDAKNMALWQFMKNGSGGGIAYYYGIEARSSNLHPLDPSDNNLPFSKVGDSYEVDHVWSAEPMCGWLTDGVSELYLMYYEYWMGPDMYIALRGDYVNSSLMAPEWGTAWFDGASGEFMFFTFDSGWLETATPDDPTGVIAPYVQLMQVMEGTGGIMGIYMVPMGDWSVVDLMFVPDWVAPSGDYASLFYISDWGGRGAANLTLFTVDNDPPIADAGPGQEAVVDTTVTLDGGMSHDNVGITTYRWTFDDGGPVELFGEVVGHDFTTLGNHTVTLTVYDGAGHSDSATTWINILGDARPVADAGADQEVPISTIVYFDGTGSYDDIGIVNYTWTIEELMEYMWGSMPEFSFSAPGIYNVTLVVEDTTGQKSFSDTMQVTAKDVTDPVADAGGDQTEMGGVEIWLNGAGSWDNVGVVNWTWTFEYIGSPVELYGEFVNFTFWVEGVYNITLNVTDAAGNWDTDEVQVTIAGIIPEFPSMMLPVMGMLAMLLFVVLRKRRH